MDILEGFGFYEILRYILPGALIYFLINYAILPEIGLKIHMSAYEYIILIILIGFMFHSIGMYKFMPKVSEIRKKYHNAVRIIFNEYGNVYIRWDFMLLSMDPYRRSHFRKYFALGSFKLELSLILFIYVFLRILIFLARIFIRHNDCNIDIKANIIAESFVYISLHLIIIFIAYILWDDGLNDLIRAFNIAIMHLINQKNRGYIDEYISIITKSKFLLINRPRFWLHPLDFIQSIISKTLGKKGKKESSNSK